MSSENWIRDSYRELRIGYGELDEEYYRERLRISQWELDKG